ncbi:MAG: DUF4258 domain-containing protein [Planctomycetota bacterium]
MRELVRTSRYVASTHAVEEMEADGLTIFDVEHGILTGTILERQRDRRTGDRKYVIEGQTLDDENVHIVAKIGPTRKLVIITVYWV